MSCTIELSCTIQCIDNRREDDIQDHSEINIRDVQGTFARHKAELQRSAARRGQPLPPHTRKDIRIQNFENYKIENDPSYACGLLQVPYTPGDCLPRAYPPSVTPVAQLKKIMIPGLQLETHHRGHYALLKTITEVYNRYWAMVLVEDEEGHNLLLQLHNQGPYLANDLGTVFLVKEPYVIRLADRTFGIRVDHPADVKSIPEFDFSNPALVFGGIKEGEEKDDVPVSPSPNFWKKKGNDFCGKKKYGLAIEW